MKTLMFCESVQQNYFNSLLNSQYFGNAPIQQCLYPCCKGVEMMGTSMISESDREHMRINAFFTCLLLHPFCSLPQFPPSLLSKGGELVFWGECEQQTSFVFHLHLLYPTRTGVRRLNINSQSILVLAVKFSNCGQTCLRLLIMSRTCIYDIS